MASSVLEAALGFAASAGWGEPEGLRRLIDTLSLEITLCNQIGHSRPEEGSRPCCMLVLIHVMTAGSEHYFYYCLEEMVKQQTEPGQEPSYHTHAEYVGPGLLIMGIIQGTLVSLLPIHGHRLSLCQ